MVLNSNTISEPHFDPDDSEDNVTIVHVWGAFDITTGGYLAKPVFNQVYRMGPGDTLLLRASIVAHHVTRWRQMFRQRFNLVHVLPSNMSNFNAVKEDSEKMRKAKENDTVTDCQLCGKAMNGTAARNIHFSNIITKGGDAKHSLEEANQLKAESQAETEIRYKERKEEQL